MRVKKLRQIDFLFLILAFAYAFDIGDIKYVISWCFVALYIIRGRLLDEHVMVGIGKEYLLILKGIIFLFIITIALQFVYGFNSYAINEAIYFFTPLMVVIVYSQLSKVYEMEKTYYCIFVLYIIAFLKLAARKMSIESIRSISFKDSYSPFESELAFVFLIFECYFLFKNKKVCAFISLVLCFLSLKRLCMVAAISMFVFHKWIIQDKKINSKIVILVTVVFVLIPVITCFTLNDEFELWFYNNFNITLYDASMTRSSRIEAVIDSGQIKFGLGSVTTYLTEHLNLLHGSNFAQRNLHNVLVQIYLECGLLGSCVFTYVYMKASSISRTTFILMIYIFMESYFNPTYGAGTTGMWILIYLLISIVGVSSKQDARMEN